MICANNSSLPEVAGEAALLSMQIRVKRSLIPFQLWDNASMRSALIERGQDQLKNSPGYMRSRNSQVDYSMGFFGDFSSFFPDSNATPKECKQWSCDKEEKRNNRGGIRKERFQ